mgnify:CR=1 FL=1
MQPPKWPGLGFPIGTTPFVWFCAGPQGPAMNDDNKDTKCTNESPSSQQSPQRRPSLHVVTPK